MNGAPPQVTECDPHKEEPVMSGSEVEPAPADQAATQMQEATERLRNKAWMVAPMTNGVVQPALPETPAEVES